VKRAALMALTWAAVACTRENQAAPATSNQAPSAAAADAGSGGEAVQPAYLVRLAKDGDLYARQGKDIVDAPPADIAVLRRYPAWSDKGVLSARGDRLTILTAKDTYAFGEEVRIVHVHEATKAGVELYVMGPKEIFGEYIDGKLVSRAAAAPPAPYDGRVVASPGADHNYEVSAHRLERGVHEIEWRFETLSGPPALRSNKLTITVK